MVTFDHRTQGKTTPLPRTPRKITPLYRTIFADLRKRNERRSRMARLLKIQREHGLDAVSEARHRAHHGR